MSDDIDIEQWRAWLDHQPTPSDVNVIAALGGLRTTLDEIERLRKVRKAAALHVDAVRSEEGSVVGHTLMKLKEALDE